MQEVNLPMKVSQPAVLPLPCQSPPVRSRRTSCVQTVARTANNLPKPYLKQINMSWDTWL